MRSIPQAARILVVDDDPGVLRAAQRVLGGQFTLSAAATPAEALSGAIRFDPDLAILDVRMPGMDGFELMRRLKEILPDLDVIFVTGSMTDPDAHLIRAIRQGAFYFVQKPFDREVLLTLVERCLELRQLRELANRELDKLRRAQARLLPQQAPEHPGYRLAFRYRPVYFASGDYHDFFPQADGSLAVFIGDSTGHGPSACMLMATMRSLLHTHPDIHGDPGCALTRLTRLFHSLIPSDLFMTAVYLWLEDQGRIRWAAAGQHPPIRLTANGEVAASDLGAVRMPLGIDPDLQYPTVSHTMQPGERLVLFTDGLIEATNRKGKLLGLARLQNLLAKLGRLDTEALLDGILDGVKHYMDGAEFEDDLTLLAVERRSQ